MNQHRAKLRLNLEEQLRMVLVLSLASKVAMELLPDYAENSIRINYGFNKVRFTFGKSNSEYEGHYS